MPRHSKRESVRYSKRDSHYTDSDFEDEKYWYYKELKRSSLKVKFSGSIYRCPFCDDKNRRDYCLTELLRHATRIEESESWGFRDRARHSALKSYTRRYLCAMDDSKPTTTAAAKRESPNLKDNSPCIAKPECSQGTNNRQPASKQKCTLVKDNSYSDSNKPAKIRRSSNVDDVSQVPKSRDIPTVADDNQDELLVFPWMGIVANIETTKEAGGRCVGESGARIREEFKSKGFNPVKVHPLWTHRGHSGFGIVEFNKDWGGFKNAMMFDKSFLLEHHGRRDYYVTHRHINGLYGWVARADDYHSRCIIGDHLRKHGDLKTVSGKEAEDQLKHEKLFSTLHDTWKEKDMCVEEMKHKFNETRTSLTNLIHKKDEMVSSYNEEIKKMQQNEHGHLKKILLDHAKATQQLLSQKKELEQVENQLQQRFAKNDNERRRLEHEKKKNIRAALEEQKKADDDVLRLAEEQKKQKEELHRKIIELEKQLDAKQALELDIEQMRGSLEVMKHMKGEEDDGAKIKKMEEDLQEKEENLESLEAENQALVVKQRKTNDELQEARKELINDLKIAGRPAPNVIIGVKRMGELDTEPFVAAAKRKYPKDKEVEVKVKAVELVSFWEGHLRDPAWHPFKVISDDNQNSKEIINDEDEKLKNIKEELGLEVYNAMVIALSEMNEYNPSGRYIVTELWNYREKRRAMLKEGVQHLMRQWKPKKQGRR